MGAEKIVALENANGPAASTEIRCRGYAQVGGSQYVFSTINSRSSPTGETIVTDEMAFTTQSERRRIERGGAKTRGVLIC